MKPGAISGCPFYGFRWPDRSPTLQYVGGNECGLDIDENGACIMEIQSHAVNYFACPLVADRWNTLQGSSQLIAFDDGQGNRQTLADWKAHAGE